MLNLQDLVKNKNKNCLLSAAIYIFDLKKKKKKHTKKILI